MLTAVSVTWLVNKPPTSACDPEMAAHSDVRTIHPTRVVVRPWQGPHHVYGVFMVPNRYNDDRRYSATLSVRGFDTEFAARRSPRHDDGEDVALAAPGHQVKRGYVPTRVALQLLFAGQFGDLRAPCNWALVFAARDR